MPPGENLRDPNKGKHHDADIIFGWNKNEGNWFAVYLLEGYSKDHQSLIQQDTFVRNLNKCGLRLNEIGISTVAFEYGPWSRSQVGKPEGNFGASNSLPFSTSGFQHTVMPLIKLLVTSTLSVLGLKCFKISPIRKMSKVSSDSKSMSQKQ